MAGQLQKENFEVHVGGCFRLKGIDFPLILDRIDSHGDGAACDGGREPFTLIFRAPKSAPVAPEGLYSCEIEGGPSHDLYIAPINTPDPAAQEYQAAFN